MTQEFFGPLPLSGFNRDRDRQWLGTIDATQLRFTPFILLGEATADGTSATLEVTSIPQTHKDMLVLIQGSNDAGSAQTREVRCTLNDDTTANSYRYIASRRSDADVQATNASQADTSWRLGLFGDKNNLSSLRMEIPDYTTAVQKAASWQIGASTGTSAGQSFMVSGSGQHTQSAAVASIQFLMGGGDLWESGTTLRVYGLA